MGKPSWQTGKTAAGSSLTGNIEEERNLILRKETISSHSHIYFGSGEMHGLHSITSRTSITRELSSSSSSNLIVFARHTLLVTGMGSVFSAGDGTDGALGLGGRESSEAFRLVEW